MIHIQICLCGTQAGYPHHEHCPFPLYAYGPEQEAAWIEGRNRIKAYDALVKAAERIGANNYANGTYRVHKFKNGRVKRGYKITQAHQDVIDAMKMLGQGQIASDEAMSLLHRADIMKERLG